MEGAWNMTIEYKDSKRIVGLSSDVVETPTVNDDLTTDKGWVSNTSDWTYNATGDYIDFATIRRSTTAQQIYIDVQDSDYLGSGNNLSDSAWTARFKFKTGTQGSSTGNVLWYMSFSNNLGDSGTTQQTVAMRTNVNGGGNANSLALCVSRGQFETSSSPVRENADVLSNTNLPYSTDLYMEMTRNGDVFTLKAFTDEYVTQTGSTASVTVTGISSLRYLKAFTDSEQQQSYTSSGGRLYDMKIYNGVTSLSSKPTNVQDNSILVEKDTARRYWRSGEVSGSDTNTSQSTYNDDSGIGSFTGGWGARFNANHALVGQEIRSIKVRMKCASPNTVNMTARLYGSTKATLRATSTAVSSSGLTSSYVDKTFVFPSGSRGVVQAGDHLMIVSDTAVASSGGWNCQIKSSAGTNTHFTTWQDQTNTFTEQTNRELWYDPIVSGTFTPATWTMQPTWRDDFSTDNWDNMSSRINVNTTTEKLDFAMYRDGANDSAVYDLGAGNVSDTAWVLRWKMNFTAVYASGNGNRLWFGLSSLPQTTNQATAQDSIMMYQNHDGTDCFSASYSNDASLPQTNTKNPDYATGTDYYCELKRTSSTTIESRMWTGGYDGTLLSNAEDSVSNSTIGSVTGLRYVKMSNIYASQGGSVITGTIDDLEFYNGVSSIN
jgi:hypothetical protein